MAKGKSIKHGAACVDAVTPEYQSWKGMIQRCYNPNANNYHCYGGRGITVHERWRTSFACFLDDMGTRPQGTSLDRYPDNNGNYEPGNCRWATQTEQLQNQSRNKLLTYNGETMCVTEWSRRVGIPVGVLIYRQTKQGWSIEQTLTTPVPRGGSHDSKLLNYNGESRSVTEWARRVGISRGTIRSRLKKGWTVESALTTPVS